MNKHSLIKSLILFLPQLYSAAPPKRFKIALLVIKQTVTLMHNFLNLKEHQNRLTGSKVIAILLKGWILLIGAVALGRVCACTLRSRLG